MTDRVETGGKSMRSRALIALILIAIAPLARAGGKMPPLPAIVGVCRDNGFPEEVCNPSPRLAPLIGIPKARLADGNTGPLWITVAGISFTSALNDERFLLRYEEITGICTDHTTTEASNGDERFTTSVRQRHYFCIMTSDRDVIFWVPGGTTETNKAPIFFHAILGHILPVSACELRPAE
jgi:hypothetical protein